MAIVTQSIQKVMSSSLSSPSSFLIEYGSKNTIGTIFGLQIGLIAILTCFMSVVGYYFFIDAANGVLLDSLKRIAAHRIVLDLKFLIFQPDIAIQNCILIVILAILSLAFPLIKIKNIKPVKIIKTKE